jgi:DNA-binding protein YbaB
LFNKLKQLKQLKDLQDSLGKEVTEAEKDGVKVTINGKFEVQSVTLNPALEKEKQEKILKECVNDAIKKVQMAVAKKMSSMPGFGL